jgi:hypothetical protein
MLLRGWLTFLTSRHLRRERAGDPLCRSGERTAGWTCESLALGRVPGRPSLRGQGVRDAKVLKEESVEEAWARIGEDLYHPALYNCEHFVTWCITGKTRSTQVDLLFGLTGGVWRLLLSRSGPLLHALYRWIRSNSRERHNRFYRYQRFCGFVCFNMVLTLPEAHLHRFRDFAAWTALTTPQPSCLRESQRRRLANPHWQIQSQLACPNRDRGCE